MVTGMDGADARTGFQGTRFADVRRVVETGSTNADLLALAAEGAPDGLVLVADHQTAGRGRMDRTWEAPPGSSLLCSVLLREGLEPSTLPLVTMAVAIAASDACDAVTGVRPELKWPNDLLLAGPDGSDRKLGGILAESVLRGGDVRAVVVGLGLNVNWPDELPPELAAIATSLNRHVGHDVDREELLTAFLRGLEAILGALRAVHGGEALLLRYRHLCSTIGRQVRVELSSGALVGTAIDVTDEGHLLVELAGELVPVAAGDVVHLRPVD